jgi:acetyl-CoA carboxylase biotin carboxyl carrier protein
MAELDLDLVKHALTVARQYGFAEVELNLGDQSFTAKLDPTPKKKAVAATGSDAVAEPELLTITSTLVGYYREAKNPLKIGATVKKGDVVAVISALGLTSDVESKHTGEVVEVLVEPNQAVEYGQPLAKVKP